MFRVLILVTLALSIASSVKAQDTPKVEVFGGYSYAGSGSHGFDMSIAGNVNQWFGLVGDIGGQYSRLSDQGFTERIRSHSFLFGPQFTLRKHKRITPFVHTLFGFSKLRTETNEFGPLLRFSDTSFALALGGGLDVRITDHLAIRAIQVDYLHTRFFNESQNKGRVTAGLVVRFGKR